MINYLRYKSSQVIFSILAIASIALFAIWWFNFDHLPQNFTGYLHFIDILLFFLVSYVIWQPITMQVLAWAISSHIKGNKKLKPLPGLKVAFITTLVPSSEPLSLLHQCLPAMVKADYPHDTWLLDEGNDPKAKAICESYGVKHFSRCGKEEFNTPNGKFTKTKGGNHNSWYEVSGNDYDIVAQIDTDFVPKKSFLTKTLGYFRDPKVAFVGTPQIYGNVGESLIARGAAEQQYSFYGPVLRGLSGMGMNLLIGANHVIRVKALKEVDHYTAHITEDLITGMKLHARGYKSVYVREALAIGEGPSTWEAYFNQQMRWAYGCMDILFHHSPKFFKRMGFRRSVYYFFLQQHYFSGIAMALSILLLSLYFAFGIRAADIDLVKFLGFYSVIILVGWLMSNWLQRYHVYRKKEEELLLAGKIIGIASWPIWFLAFLSILRGKRLNYKVTPKGEDGKSVTTLKVFIPHIIFGVLALAGVISSFFTHRQSPIMIYWALASGILMLLVPFAEPFEQKFSSAIKNFIKLAHFIAKLNQKPKASKPQPYLNYNLTLNFLNPSRLKTQRLSEVSQKLADCIFLGLAVTASFIFYVNRLGFYSDDWAFLGNFSVSPSQSLWSLFLTATTPNTLMRPMQNFYDALLYWLFGFNSTGYQLVNGFVLVGITVLFYLVLRRIKVSRIMAICIPLLYALLPNYTADRFWYAAFQANLSMLLFFFSLYAGLKVFSTTTKNTFIWKALCIISLLLSALSYEVVLPLLLVNALLFWNPKRLFSRSNFHHLQIQNRLVFVILNFIALAYIFAFKALTTTRLSVLHFPDYIINTLSSAFKTNYGTFVFNLPQILGEIFSKYSNPEILISGYVLYLVIFFYLVYILFNQRSNLPRARYMIGLSFLGLLVFVLGYSIFFTNNQIGFSPTGVENRVAVAASIGVAMTIIGLIGWAAGLLPEKYAKITFSLLFSLVCAGGFIVINTLAQFWAVAYSRQQIVLSSIEQQLPSIPKHSTLILDGVCPYVGPAVVFESQWDLKGALQSIYHDPSLEANIVTPRLYPEKDGVHTQIYTFPANYPYNNLYVYNYQYKTVYAINSANSAQDYFQKYNPDRTSGCQQGSAGEGVNVF